MEFVQQNLMWIGLAFFSGGMLLWQTFSAAGASAINTAAATLLMNREDAVVLDVRETGEWDTGHIAGARHIALGQLEKRLSEIDKFKTRPIIVCCAHGSRSATACGQLKKAGFEKVFSLSGGMSAWLEANLPITTKG